MTHEKKASGASREIEFNTLSFTDELPELPRVALEMVNVLFHQTNDVLNYSTTSTGRPW